MKKLLLGILALSSITTFAQELDNRVEKIARECSSKYQKTMKLGKVSTCKVSLTPKAALSSPVFCIGETTNKNICKISLIENELKSECRSKSEGDLWSRSSDTVQTDFFQPTFSVIGSKAVIKSQSRGNATVISAESDNVSLTVFHETLVSDNQFKSNAIISMKKTPLKDGVLSNVSCYILD